MSAGEWAPRPNGDLPHLYSPRRFPPEHPRPQATRGSAHVTYLPRMIPKSIGMIREAACRQRGLARA